MARSYKREQRLLLNAVFERDETPALYDAEVDWKYLGDTAVRHGVAPLLHERWKTRPDVPASLRSRLQACYYATATRNMHQFQAVTAVVSQWRQAGVEALVLKGASLAEPVYGNSALRPCEDVDVLIRRADFATAKTILESMGFIAPNYLWPDAFYLEQHFHLPFVREKPVRVYLELHWDFTDRFMLYTPDMASIWSRAGTRLEAHDEWIYLAMHVAKHGAFNAAYQVEQQTDVETFFFDPLTDNRLIWMVDLWRLLKHSQDALDWEQLAKRARAWGATQALASALFLLEGLYAAPLPVPKEMKEATRVSRTQRWLYRMVVRPNASPQFAWLFKMNARLQFRPIRLLDALRYLFPPASYLARRYGCRSGWAIVPARFYHAGHCLIQHAVRPALLLLTIPFRRRRDKKNAGKIITNP